MCASRVRLADRARGGEAVGARHAQVHEHDVGPELAREPDRLLAVARAADDLDPAVEREDRLERLGEEQMVVDDQDADHVGRKVRAWATEDRSASASRSCS